MTTDMHQRITDKFVQALSHKGRLPPWGRPWIPDRNAGPPTHTPTGIPFRGIEAALLQITANEHGYWSKWWASESTWRIVECCVRPGEQGTEIGRQDGPLFNAEQCEHADKFQVDDVDHGFRWSWKEAEKLVQASGLDIRHLPSDEAAYYRPPKDFIVIPLEEQFAQGPFGLAGLYQTLFHEIAHATEHRLGWFAAPNLSVADRYALGELRADWTAGRLVSLLGLPFVPPTNLKFVSRWIRLLSADKTLVFKMAGAVDSATDFIMSFGKKEKVSA